ncbi:hypothetical protein ACLMJK_002864 [Lecanora helva]
MANIQAFPPPRLLKPKRVLASTKSLQSLPRELVHQVLDDLTVIQVLQIISNNESTTYIEECVLGHPEYGSLFADVLPELRDIYIIYHCLRKSLNEPLAPPISPLAQGIRYLPRGPSLVRHLIERVSSTLHTIPDHRLQVLAEALNRSHTSLESIFGRHPTYTCKSLYNQWQLIATGQSNLNKAKASQLSRMADLFEEYPQFLKRTLDPSQVARPNYKYIASQFRRYARSVATEQFLKGKDGTKAAAAFRMHILPIMPLDSCLRFFIRYIDYHPNWEGKSAATTPASTEKPLPTNIIRDIHTAITGMSHIYISPEPGTRDPPPIIPRTRSTPFSDKTYRLYYPSRLGWGIPTTLPKRIQKDIEQHYCWQPINQNVARLFPIDYQPTHNPGKMSRKEFEHRRNGPLPFARAALPDHCWDDSHGHAVFTIPPSTHLGRLFVDKVELEAQPRWERIVPYPEEEFEWLEAFLRVVKCLTELREQQEASLNSSRGRFAR